MFTQSSLTGLFTFNGDRNKNEKSRVQLLSKAVISGVK